MSRSSEVPGWRVYELVGQHGLEGKDGEDFFWAVVKLHLQGLITHREGAAMCSEWGIACDSDAWVGEEVSDVE